MQFIFLDAAGTPYFVREDAEQATWTHEEMGVSLVFPYDAGKQILHGMRVGFRDCRGDFQLFEIRKARTLEPDHYQEITAEHIAISELTDEVLAENQKLTDETVGNALDGVLDGTQWETGTVTAGIPVSTADIKRGNVWSAVRTIEENWNVYIIPRVTYGAAGITGRYLDVIPAKGTFRGLRLSLEKNAAEAGVIWDDSKLKTALYGFGKTQEASGDDDPPPLTFEDVVWAATASHPAKPSGQAYIEDPAATAAFGRNGRARYGYYQNGEIGDAETLLEKTWETLKTVSVPDVEISCTVADLYRLGYADVPIRLHDTADIEIRPTNVHLQKEIIRMTEDLLDPMRTRLIIGAYIPNIVYINRETAKHGGGGGGSGGQTDQEYQFQEYQTSIEQSNTEIKLVAQHLDEAVGVLEEAGIAIESGGVLIYQLDTTKGVGAEINSIAVTVEGIVIEGNKIKIKGETIDMDGYVTIAQLDVTDARIDNLINGTTLAATIKANQLQASSSFSLGGHPHHNSTLTIDGVNYNIVTWS